MTLYFSALSDPHRNQLPESQLDSAIPPSHPHKSAIEETLREMTRLPGGPWRVEVRPARAYGWWFVQVTAEGCGFQRTMTLPPEQQNPDAIRTAWSRAWLGVEAGAKEVTP